MSATETASLIGGFVIAIVWHDELVAVGKTIGWNIGRLFWLTLNIDIGEQDGETH